MPFKCLMFITVLFLTAPFCATSQQDSSLINLKKRLRFTYQVGADYQSRIKDSSIEQHPYIQFLRRRGLGFNRAQQITTDSPLFHGALFGGIHTALTIAEGYELNAGLIGEHRGTSFGTFNTRNTIVYPLLSGHAADQFRIGRHEIKFFGDIGYFLNIRLAAGLDFYNMDAQGISLGFEFKKIRFRHTHLADGIAGIGLGEDDPLYYSITRIDLPLFKTWMLDIGVGMRNTIAISSANQLIPMFFFKLRKAENLELFGQLNYRFFQERFVPASYQVNVNYQHFYIPGLKEKIGLLVGIKSEMETTKIRWEQTSELRYYGKMYNFGRLNRNIRFRERLDRNTIGDQLYPLFAYQRPYSQWAVFTEFENRNVLGIIHTSHIKYQLYRKWYIPLEIDLNIIKAEGYSTFAYTFYTTGISYYPAPDMEVSMIVTNKAMNLDNHFPTFYQMRFPMVGYRIRRQMALGWYGQQSKWNNIGY